MMRGVSVCSSWKSIQNPTLFASSSLPDWSWSRAEQARLGYFPLLAEKNVHLTIFSNSKSKPKKARTKWQDSRVPEAAWELERIKTLDDFFLDNIRAG